MNHLRGHAIYAENDEWFYTDTRTPCVDRPCGHCGRERTPEDHDGCLGTLPESVVMNACCGHGQVDEAYVQFWDGDCIRGEKAVRKIDALKGVMEGV